MNKSAKEITAEELIRRIQNGEIKPRTHIRYHKKSNSLDYKGDIYFNGNWFSKEPYYIGVDMYDEIIVLLCDKCVTYEIINDEDLKEIELSSDNCIEYFENGIKKYFNTNKKDLFYIKILNELIKRVNKLRKEDK